MDTIVKRGRGRPRKVADPEPAAVTSPALDLVEPPEPQELIESAVPEGVIEIDTSDLGDPASDFFADAPARASGVSEVSAVALYQDTAGPALDVSEAMSDPLNIALGSYQFQMEWNFNDWCYDHNGFRHHFTRFYHIIGVLLDRYERMTTDVQREIAEKAGQIAVYNARPGITKLGYIALDIDDLPTIGEVDRAKRGQIVPYRPKMRPHS